MNAGNATEETRQKRTANQISEANAKGDGENEGRREGERLA